MTPCMIEEMLREGGQKETIVQLCAANRDTSQYPCPCPTTWTSRTPFFTNYCRVTVLPTTNLPRSANGPNGTSIQWPSLAPKISGDPVRTPRGKPEKQNYRNKPLLTSALNRLRIGHHQTYFSKSMRYELSMKPFHV